MNGHTPSTRYRQQLAASVLAAFLALSVPGCTGTGAGGARTQKDGIANPASVNCIRQGGALTILKRGDGGEYGLCTFRDGRLCEEWALFRGECPEGGVRVAQDATPAARYCLITGGFYRAGGLAGTPLEEGICRLPEGIVCDAGEYFAGKCPASSGPTR